VTLLGGRPVSAILVLIGSLAIGILLMTAYGWVPAWLSAPTAALKPPVRRVTRIVGLAIQAAVTITFLHVSADINAFDASGGGSATSTWTAVRPGRRYSPTRTTSIRSATHAVTLRHRTYRSQEASLRRDWLSRSGARPGVGSFGWRARPCLSQG
jgi:hypothetical protein